MDIVIIGLDDIVRDWASAAGQSGEMYCLDFDEKAIVIIVENPVAMLGGIEKERYNKYSALIHEYLPEWRIDIFPKRSTKHRGFLACLKKLRGTT